VLQLDQLGVLAGRATIELVRAMLISAVRPEERDGSGVSSEALRYAVKQYIQRHLRDPGLSPAAIARAHHISVRHLYNVWNDEQVTVGRRIGLQRLEAAREDLANPHLAHKSIAAVGREWGFPAPAHFARRFREAYAMSPREWREAGAARP
jgi:AraC-like DNA-binding protein